MGHQTHGTGDRWFDRFMRVYLVFFVTYLVTLPASCWIPG